MTEPNIKEFGVSASLLYLSSGRSPLNCLNVASEEGERMSKMRKAVGLDSQGSDQDRW
jgi:hypothetical protein